MELICMNFQTEYKCLIMAGFNRTGLIGALKLYKRMILDFTTFCRLRKLGLFYFGLIRPYYSFKNNIFSQ
jgi:hypothetical protein